MNPALRGRGLAMVVVELALALAQRFGAETVRLNVISTNAPAARTYLRTGFVQAAGGSVRDDVTMMERRLVDGEFATRRG